MVIGRIQGSPDSRLVKALALARDIGLTREDRMDLAEKLLWQDCTSWKQLDPAQVDRLLDALEGYESISWLLGAK